MPESYGEGVASHTGPKPCAGARAGWAKRRQGNGRAEYGAAKVRVRPGCRRRPEGRKATQGEPPAQGPRREPKKKMCRTVKEPHAGALHGPISPPLDCRTGATKSYSSRLEKTGLSPLTCFLHVQVLDGQGVLLDEVAAEGHVVAHEDAEHAFGFLGFVGLDAEQDAALRVHGGFP